MNDITTSELRKYALEMWANTIETEDPAWSIRDVRARMTNALGSELRALKKIHLRWENLAPSSLDRIKHLRELAFNETQGRRATPLTLPEQELVSQALSGWANWIETNSMTLSKNDVLEQVASIGLKTFEAHNPKVHAKTLNDEQINMVAKLRRLSVEAIHPSARPKVNTPQNNPELWGKILHLRAKNPNGNDLILSTAISEEMVLRLMHAKNILHEHQLKALSFELKAPVQADVYTPVNVFDTAVQVNGNGFIFTTSSHDSRYAGGLTTEEVNTQAFLDAVRAVPTNTPLTVNIAGNNVFFDPKSKSLFEAIQSERADMAQMNTPRG